MDISSIGLMSAARIPGVRTNIPPVGDTTAVKEDSASIAKEAKRAKEEAAKQKLKEAEAQKDIYIQQMEAAQAQAKAVGDEAKVQGKCITIAARIMAGDEVPKEDHRFLAKNNSELYAKAITLRITRQNPKKHKRLSKDEEVKDASGAKADNGTEDIPEIEGSPDNSEASPAPPEGESGGGSVPEHIDIHA